MKQKLSFHDLLHNNRLLGIISLVAAVVIWAAVAYGPSSIKERTIKVNVPLDLTDTYADTIGLCILDKEACDVTVSVEGKWSVISALTAEDINVRADFSALKKSGNQTVSFTAGYNSAVTDYDIVSVYPASVSVACDYWETDLSYKVTPDLSNVTVTDTDRYQLGDAVLDPTALPEGTVQLEGPRSVTNRIRSFVARVEEKQQLSDVAVLDSRLVALNKKGNEVDISRCKLLSPTADTVGVTVPVWVSRKVEFTCALEHLPAEFSSPDKAVTLSPASVVLVGPESDMDTVAASITDVGTFDFDNLLPKDAKQVIPLNLPAGYTVLDDVKAVTAQLNVADEATRSYDLALEENSRQVVFKNLPAGLTASLPKQTISGIRLVGKDYTLRNVGPEELTVTVDMANATTGSGRYEARIAVKGKDKVWTYYGEDAHSFSVYVTVTKP